MFDSASRPLDADPTRQQRARILTGFAAAMTLDQDAREARNEELGGDLTALGDGETWLPEMLWLLTLGIGRWGRWIDEQDEKGNSVD
ncbi:hypothetical protein [Catenulispora rubra]|uniref:hypothetical protein n=1 Tax=Catenulispora rubra TaxID=280293 RepID=UPI0018926A5C|nr:hypothetical protein [Catenulispora rubra]